MTRIPEFKGTLTALATPFKESDLSIDFASLDNLVEFQLKAGIDGIVSCGSTAEAASLTDNEYRELAKYLADKCRGNVQCIGGVITNNTKRACEMAELMSSLKYDAILLVNPPYIKPTQEGIIEHFKAVKNACGLPILAYNIPGRSGSTIQNETLKKLYEAGLISGLKDSTGSIEFMLETATELKDKLDILSGEDTLVYPIMTCGGKGVISASANVIPEIFLEITSNALKGNWNLSLAAQLRAQKLIKALFTETNPIPVKTALVLKGIFKSDSVRIPLTKSKPETRERLRELLT